MEPRSPSTVPARHDDAGRRALPDEGHVVAVPDAREAGERAVFLVSVKDDAIPDLVLQLQASHVGIVPAVVRYDALVGLRPVVDDVEDSVEVVVCTDVSLD